MQELHTAAVPELSQIRGKAWSLENRAGHGADDREIREVGREVIGLNTYVYYIDDAGAYWYQTEQGAAFESEMKQKEIDRRKREKAEYRRRQLQAEYWKRG